MTAQPLKLPSLHATLAWIALACFIIAILTCAPMPVWCKWISSGLVFLAAGMIAEKVL